jgi:putative heme iron utilization protein
MATAGRDTVKAPKDAAALGAHARGVMRALDRAALATVRPDGGAPYASLVMAALDDAARPLLLISDLAEHTKNLRADGRASLLFDATPGLDSPLTGTRVTVQGVLAPCDDAAALARYVRRHPEAEMFTGFKDFALWRMAVERAHMVAGFGAIDWIGSEALLPPGLAAPALAEAEADICEHMNADHADAVALFARHLAGMEGEGWEMTGIDPEGCDLRLGGAVARVEFDAPIDRPDAARRALVEMTGKARRKAAEKA